MRAVFCPLPLADKTLCVTDCKALTAEGRLHNEGGPGALDQLREDPRAVGPAVKGPTGGDDGFHSFAGVGLRVRRWPASATTGRPFGPKVSPRGGPFPICGQQTEAPGGKRGAPDAISKTDLQGQNTPSANAKAFPYGCQNNSRSCNGFLCLLCKIKIFPSTWEGGRFTRCTPLWHRKPIEAMAQWLKISIQFLSNQITHDLWEEVEVRWKNIVLIDRHAGNLCRFPRRS